MPPIFLSPYFVFNGNDCHVSTVLELYCLFYVCRNYFTGPMAVPHFILKCLVETMSSDEADFHSWTFAHSVWWSWDWRTETGGAVLHDKPPSGHNLHCSDASIHWVELICGNHCITIDELCTTLFLGKGKESEIIEQLGYFTHWGWGF